jgi:proteasome accessory factor B
MSPARDRAEDQLGRLLWLIPAASRGDGLPLAEAARHLGVEVEQLHRDIHILTGRDFYHPAGSADMLQIELTDRVYIHTTGGFGRPPRLTRAEWVCVLLGLRMRPGDHGELVRRLEDGLAMAGGGPSTTDPAPVTFPDLEEAGRTDAVLAALRRARAARRPCRFGYLKPGADAPELRRLHCYALVHAEGAWYAAGHDPDAGGHRNFRLDRILGIESDGESGAYDIPEDFEPGELLDGARLFQLPEAGEAVQVEIRYGPRVAIWIREQWRGETDDDGGYRVRHTVGNPDWVVRHVLQYGPDAEVIGPPEMRRAVAEAARRMAG